MALPPGAGLRGVLLCGVPSFGVWSLGFCTRLAPAGLQIFRLGCGGVYTRPSQPFCVWCCFVAHFVCGRVLARGCGVLLVACCKTAILCSFAAN